MCVCACVFLYIECCCQSHSHKQAPKRDVSFADITQTLKTGQGSRVFHLLLVSFVVVFVVCPPSLCFCLSLLTQTSILVSSPFSVLLYLILFHRLGPYRAPLEISMSLWVTKNAEEEMDRERERERERARKKR